MNDATLPAIAPTIPALLFSAARQVAIGLAAAAVTYGIGAIFGVTLG